MCRDSQPGFAVGEANRPPSPARRRLSRISGDEEEEEEGGGGDKSRTKPISFSSSSGVEWNITYSRAGTCTDSTQTAIVQPALPMPLTTLCRVRRSACCMCLRGERSLSRAALLVNRPVIPSKPLSTLHLHNHHHHHSYYHPQWADGGILPAFLYLRQAFLSSSPVLLRCIIPGLSISSPPPPCRRVSTYNIPRGPHRRHLHFN